MGTLSVGQTAYISRLSGQSAAENSYWAYDVDASNFTPPGAEVAAAPTGQMPREKRQVPAMQLTDTAGMLVAIRKSPEASAKLKELAAALKAQEPGIEVSEVNVYHNMAEAVGKLCEDAVKALLFMVPGVSVATALAQSGRSKREVKVYEIREVPNTLADIRNSPQVSAKLLEAAARAKGEDINEAEVKVYRPMFKELGKECGAAVKAFLLEEGVPEHLIKLVLRGPGPFNDNWELAKARGVRIELEVKEPPPAKEGVWFECGHAKA